MMKIILFVFAYYVLLVNCSKDEKTSANDCNTDNPMEEFGWLKEMKDTLTNCTCQLSIVQGTYLNQTVFYLAITDPVCNGISIPTLYNCNGKAVKKYSTDDFRDFNHQVTFDSILYSCKN